MRSKLIVVILGLTSLVGMSYAIVEHDKLSKVPPTLTSEEKADRQFMIDEMQQIQGQINVINVHAKTLKEKVDAEHPGYQLDMTSGDLIPIPTPVKK